MFEWNQWIRRVTYAAWNNWMSCQEIQILSKRLSVSKHKQEKRLPLFQKKKFQK
jgi:Fe-S cluster biosynthesis and repair protein YggX